MRERQEDTPCCKERRRIWIATDVKSAVIFMTLQKETLMAEYRPARLLIKSLMIGYALSAAHPNLNLKKFKWGSYDQEDILLDYSSGNVFISGPLSVP
jgi:hypothetical protein